MLGRRGRQGGRSTHETVHPDGSPGDRAAWTSFLHALWLQAGSRSWKLGAGGFPPCSFLSELTSLRGWCNRLQFQLAPACLPGLGCCLWLGRILTTPSTSDQLCWRASLEHLATPSSLCPSESIGRRVVDQHREPRVATGAKDWGT